MTTIRELGSKFPGSWEEKRMIKLHLKHNQVTVYYEDGTELKLKDPVQVQDFPVPADLIEVWFKKLRDADTSITRYVYRERSYLQRVLQEVQSAV